MEASVVCLAPTSRRLNIPQVRSIREIYPRAASVKSIKLLIFFWAPN